MAAPTEPTVAQMLAAVLPVIVGGILAVGGGALTQWYLHRTKTEEERRTKRAVKFEELVATVYEYDHWLDGRRNKVVFGEDVNDMPSPYAKLLAISAVNFPQFTARITAMQVGARKYEMWRLCSSSM